MSSKYRERSRDRRDVDRHYGKSYDRERDSSRNSALPRHRQEDRSEDRSRGRDRNYLKSSNRQKSRSRSGDSARGRSSRNKDSDSDRERKSSVSKKRLKNSADGSDTSPQKSEKKKKRKSKRSRSSDSSSSSSSGSSASSADSTKLMKRLHEERQKQMEMKLKEKERLKATETPEEKRLRRLLKKEAKERKRKERMGWDNDYLHYTNTDNPFGDGNLLSTFVWGKKLDREGLTGLSREELELRNRQKQEENKQELEKVKKRRQERELERQQREEEMSLLQRNKEAAQFQEWERQEDQFHLEQARLRSRIRMQDGRAKPIDLLAKYISAEEEVDAVEMHEPYTYLNGLATQDLEDLIEDIKVYKELERGKNLDYWHDITVIVEDELHKLRKLQKQNEYDSAVGRREGIHQSVAKDVASVFKGKTATQLEELQSKIESKIRNKVEGLDIGYWESLLSQLKAHMARARLRDRHQENLRKKLQVLKAEQGVSVEEEGLNQPSTSAAPDMKAERDRESEVEQGNSTDDDNENTNEEVENAANDLLKESFADYDSGGYSPRYLEPSELEPGTFVIAEEDDLQRCEFARLQITQGAGQRVENVITAEEKALQREARKGMGGDEAEFSVETQLDTQVYLWSDKYRPRKPRYFNRVHTGFEWNKYNQTHYDMDNPPPKIVQGYKFNIFYPDLIDKGATPEYFLTPCPDNKDFALLRFHAGPPYEDIAFKIVSREWEYSYKRGFRCQFHNNIFQLWFHFKRYRYRR